MSAKSVKRLIGFFLLVLASATHAQNPEIIYPSKPIRIIIPQSSGSATDTLIRLIAPKLT